MQIEKESEAQLFGTLGQSQRVIEIVRQTIDTCGGVVKEPKTNPVVVVVVQNCQHILWLSIFLEDHPLPFALGEKGNIRSNGISLRDPGRTSAAGECGKQDRVEKSTHCV